MQMNSRLLDDFARMASGAMGAAAGVREEFETLMRGQLERIFSRMDLVTREEFEAVKEMAAKARTEQEALAERLAALEKGAKGPSASRRKASKPRPPKRAAGAP